MDDDVDTPGREVVDVGGETESAVSGWSTDTLHQHMQRQVDALQVLLQTEMGSLLEHHNTSLMAAKEQSFRDVTSLREWLGQRITDNREATQQQLTDARILLDERYSTSVKALDAAFVSQQCIECSMPILCADLVWRAAGDLKVGDELIAFDEDAPVHRGGRAGRNFRRATVLRNEPMEDDLLEVDTPYGSVKCNRSHPWLVKDAHSTKWVWRRADLLKPGSKVMHIVDVWEVDRSWEGGWLAGMFDGEGWLTFTERTNTVRLGIAQSDGPTNDALELTIKERLGRAPVHNYVEPGRYHNTKGVHRWGVSKRADVMKFLGSIRPPRLMVNADKVWEGRGIAGDGRVTSVISVKPIGTGTIASLTTSTGTYIGGGFAMHNTAMRTALEAAEKAVTVALLSAEKAVVKAEMAAEKRFEAVNEFRSQLADQASTFPSRIEVDTRLVALSDKLESFQKSIAEKVEARTDSNAMRIRELTTRLDQMHGAVQGGRVARDSDRQDRALMISSVAILVTIVIAVITILVTR